MNLSYNPSAQLLSVCDDDVENHILWVAPKPISKLPKKNGELFIPCYYAFRSAPERAGN